MCECVGVVVGPLSGGLGNIWAPYELHATPPCTTAAAAAADVGCQEGLEGGKVAGELLRSDGGGVGKRGESSWL